MQQRCLHGRDHMGDPGVMADKQPRALTDFGLPAMGAVYLEIISGWLLSLLAVAGLSGIIRSD